MTTIDHAAEPEWETRYRARFADYTVIGGERTTPERAEDDLQERNALSPWEPEDETVVVESRRVTPWEPVENTEEKAND